MGESRRYCIVEINKANPKWYALSAEEQREILGPALRVWNRYSRIIGTRGFTSAASKGGVSIINVHEPYRISDYYSMKEKLAETDLFARGYFEPTDVFIGISGEYDPYVQQTYQPQSIIPELMEHGVGTVNE
ncbi:MAG: hypothetical protein ACUVXI_18665 [bacterium]